MAESPARGRDEDSRSNHARPTAEPGRTGDKRGMQSTTRLDSLLRTWSQLHGCQHILCREYLRQLSLSDLDSARRGACRMSIIAGDIARVERELSPLLAKSAV